jgi:hypothetical protein
MRRTNFIVALTVISLPACSEEVKVKEPTAQERIFAEDYVEPVSLGLAVIELCEFPVSDKHKERVYEGLEVVKKDKASRSKLGILLGTFYAVEVKKNGKYPHCEWWAASFDKIADDNW